MERLRAPSDLQNCAGLALATFSPILFCDDYSYLTYLPKPVSKIDFTIIGMERFIDRNPLLGLRLLMTPEDLKENENLVLFRFSLCCEDEDSEYIDYLYNSYDYHFVRYYNNKYYCTTYANCNVYVSDSPVWFGADGPIIYLASSRVKEFEAYISVCKQR